MRKYYTIEKTLHCDKKTLVAMISATTSMRKALDEEKNFSTGKKFLGGQNFKKKFLVRRADV